MFEILFEIQILALVNKDFLKRNPAYPAKYLYMLLSP